MRHTIVWTRDLDWSLPDNPPCPRRFRSPWRSGQLMLIVCAAIRVVLHDLDGRQRIALPRECAIPHQGAHRPAIREAFSRGSVVNVGGPSSPNMRPKNESGSPVSPSQ
jgi:hypothetical protein